MLETRTIHAPPGFDARLVREPVDPHRWLVLLSDAEHDELWLCVGATPAGIELQHVDFPLGRDAVEYRKLCALLGFEWALLDADLLKLVDWQQACQRAMGPAVRRSISNAAIEDIATWRQEITRNESALIRGALTGDDPRAVAN